MTCRIWNRDCITGMAELLEPECVDLTVTSPPFEELFTYSGKIEDVGNNGSTMNLREGRFAVNLRFWAKQLLRVHRPGTNACLHIQQLLSYKVQHGNQGRRDFRGALIDIMRETGWDYTGEVAISKDPQALRNGTSVLTPRGWKAIDALAVGDKVIGSAGRAVKVLGVYPHAPRQLYRVTFSDNTSVDCDGKHLWQIETAAGITRVMATDDIRVEGCRMPSGGARWYIPMLSAPVEFMPRPEPEIDPYTLGCLLGNGDISARSRVRVCASPEMLAMCKLPVGHSWKHVPKSERGNDMASYALIGPDGRRNDVIDHLHTAGLHGLKADVKFVPDEYLYGSPVIRLAVLQGMLDTDGTCKKAGTVLFSSTSAALKDAVVFLVQSLGGKATANLRRGGRYVYGGEERFGKPIWVVQIHLPPNVSPFRLERKAARLKDRRKNPCRFIKSIEAVDKAACTCIEVDAPDKLYVTEHCVVTHNTIARTSHLHSLQFKTGHTRGSQDWAPAPNDYVLIFQKPGESAYKVRPLRYMDKNPGGWMADKDWIEWARGHWDIDQFDVIDGATTKKKLNELKESEDEKHVCLARGSLVLTRGGYVPIETVSVGDEVLTHKGRWRPVLATKCNGVRSTVRVTAQGVADLRCTPDHRMWVRKNAGKATTAKKTATATAAAPEWVEAGQTLSHYVNLPLPPVEETPYTADEWWLVGRWLSDGHWGTRGDLHISAGRHKTESLINKMGDRAGFTSSRRTADQIRIKDRDGRMREIIAKCGKGAAGKKLPAEALTLNKDMAEALLSGYLSGDGCYTAKYDRWSASSVSRPLLLGMAMVAQRARGVVASVYAGDTAGTAVIEVRAVNTRQVWILAIPPRNMSGMILDDGAWKKVRKIETAEDVEVWDIQVAEDESFIAEGCAVHNCPLQLSLIRRLVMMYSNPVAVQPNSTVLDPFMGVGSTAFTALNGTSPQSGKSVGAPRNVVGFELKPSYYKAAVKHARIAFDPNHVRGHKSASLFGDSEDS